MHVGPRRGRHLRLAGLFLVAGVFLLGHLASGGGRAGAASAAHPLMVLAGMLMLLCAAAALLALALGVPRLRLDRNGLAVHGPWGARAAGWAQIGAFAMVSERGAHRSVPGHAVAPWLERRRRWRDRSGFVLYDVFDTPLPQLLELVALRRPDAPGGVEFAPPPPERPCGVPGFRWPWLTALLLAVMAAVFAVERHVGASLGTASGGAGDPSVAALVALGGSSRDLVAAGEWHRMLSATLLHAGLAHLVGNAVALALAGYALERLVGRVWMACIFAVGGFGGSLASLALAPSATVSVGASGAIVAMLASLLFVARRMAPGRPRNRIVFMAVRATLPALIPFGPNAARVDYGAHWGGAVVGVILGLLMLRTWRDDQPLPGLRVGAAWLVVLSVAAYAASAAAVAWHFPAYAAAAVELIPDAVMPRTGPQIDAASDRLLADYPRDPRSHVVAGSRDMRLGRLLEAELELRRAETLIAGHPPGLPPQTPATIHALLAVILLAEHRGDEAAGIAAPACIAAGQSAPPPGLLRALTSAGLCPTLKPMAASPAPHP